MIRKKVQNALKDVLSQDKIALLSPKNPAHGDYAIHVKSVGKEITTDDLKDELFSNVERVGDFINLTISPTALLDELATILEQKETYGQSKQNEPKKISLEYGDPNTHKLPHIGHLFSYIIGESWARILEANGNEVYRCIYQGDVGLHVAKCLYKVKSQKLKVKNLKTLEEKVHFLQQCYQEGSGFYEADTVAKKEINELNKKIYEEDSSVKSLWEETRQWSVDYYADFETRLGIKYDKHYFESMVAEEGKKIVQDYTGNVFEKSDGAIIFPAEKIGLHNRVFISSLGNPTYEAKDLALAKMKYDDWPYDICIITTASEQNEYFKVVFAALEQIKPEFKGKLKHIGFGMVDLKMGKMSSRTGNIISAIDLVKLVESEVQKLSDSKESVTPVSLAAIKYSFLKSEARKNISFDLSESIATTGNSGPYLLYAYARCQSILKKSMSAQFQPIATNFNLPADRQDQFQPEELALLRTFFRFPEVVEDAARHYAPHLIATYLFDLAQKFNLFYEKHQILKADADVRPARLSLTAATAQLLKNGLYLLGIETLDTI